jgi:deoxyribodipyrimidine photo-lyase
MLNFVWFRNDLRLRYSRVLEAVYKQSLKVIPIYILDTKIFHSEETSPFRRTFLIESLVSLKKALQRYNSTLVVLEGSPKHVFCQILTRYKIDNLYYSKDYTNFAKKRDVEVRKLIEENNGKVYAIKNLIVFDEEDNLLNSNNAPFKVFTPFKKAWLQKLESNFQILDFHYHIKEIFVDSSIIDDIFKGFDNLVEIDRLVINQKNDEFHGSEDEASKVWNDFKINKIERYHNNRNFLDFDGTSRLSPHLKFGTISPYEIVKFCFMNRRNKGIDTFLSEIIWREFYKYINIYFPHVETENFNSQFNNFPWEFDRDKFLAWCNGQTGYPIVDACMRCLNQTGWLHNRGRMIVGSFLCKDMHIHWKEGERHFKKKLIDWDKTSNNGGWQWVAGTGTDASPYFRIFNPILQSKKFDPEGKFIKQFIPELIHVPKEFIHEPDTMPKDLQIKYRCVIGKDYPFPIVNHEIERQKALKLYENAKNIDIFT